MNNSNVGTANIKWDQYLSTHDMVWDRLPKDWYEAPFLGNGMLGAMLYKQPGSNGMKLDIGRSDAHDHRDYSGGGTGYARPRLPVGYFLLEPLKGNITGCDMRLDLWNAELKGCIHTDCGDIEFTVIVHSEEMAILFLTKYDKENAGFKWTWVPGEAMSPRQAYGLVKGDAPKVREDYLLNPSPIAGLQDQIEYCVQPLLAGGQTVTAWRTGDTEGSDLRVISIAHSWPGESAFTEAVNTVQRVAQINSRDIFKSHRNWWHQYYPQSFITLPDTRLESFYWIQMYKLASATRRDRALIDNQGPWLQLTPWPGAWWNLNVQLTYWPVLASNRCELAESLWKTLDRHQETLINNVEEPYRHDSAGISRSSAPDLVSRVAVPGRDKTGVVELGNLTWALHNCWLYYRMTLEDGFLQTFLFPLLKRSVNYSLHFLYEGEDGRLHLLPTGSPEYGGTAEDTNYDLSLLRWGCSTLILICEQHNIEDELLSKWKEVLEKLAEYPQSEEQGYFIGKDMPYAKSHRHYSHMLMVYPLYLVNIEQENSKDIIKKSLEHWQSMPEALQGYSCTGAASIAASLGEGEEALRYLKGLWSGFLMPNTLYKESGPVIETPLSGAQSIHDMLLQSWGGKIRIFPAIPETWKDVAFHDMRAEGAFLVSAVRKNGRTEFIRLKSLKGEPCIIKTDLLSPCIISEREVELVLIGEDTVKVDLRAGEEVILHTTGKVPTYEITPCTPEAGYENCYGLNSCTVKVLPQYDMG